MCGIIAVIGKVREGQWSETHALLSELLVQSMERGTDATGFSAIASSFDRPFNHRLITAKAPQPADEFVNTNPFWKALRRMRCCSVIAHVRAATSGSPSDNRTNHPFLGRTAKGGSFSLVHNGIFLEPKETADRLSLKLATDCDSELAEKLVSSTGDFAMGLYRCLTELEGSMALVLVEHRSGTVWAVRDWGRPLWICR
ncbi:MAG: hypothetical protein ABSH08_04595, partial [Tepidisphaeraceae bacterium]